MVEGSRANNRRCGGSGKASGRNVHNRSNRDCEGLKPRDSRYWEWPPRKKKLQRPSMEPNGAESPSERKQTCQEVSRSIGRTLRASRVVSSVDRGRASFQTTVEKTNQKQRSKHVSVWLPSFGHGAQASWTQRWLVQHGWWMSLCQ